MTSFFVLVTMRVCTVSTVSGCTLCYQSGMEKMKPMPEQTIEQVQEAHADEWMAIPGVQGVGIGMSDDRPCIVIFSSVDPQQLGKTIPSTVQGHPVVIRQTGTFHALDPE